MSNPYNNPNFGNKNQPQNFGTNQNVNMMNYNQGNNIGGYNPNIGYGGNNFNLMSQNIYPDKSKQIQQLKNTYPNLDYKQVPQGNGVSYDMISFSIFVKSSGGNLEIPLTLIINSGYPDITPSVFIKKPLRHNLFEIKGQTLEIKIANFMRWTNQNTLSDLASALKTLFEKDPPQQDKIVEEVSKLLNEVNEQHFKDLVTADKFSSRTLDDLKALQSANFEEVICSSKEYKAIVQNLLNIVQFNEKTASEALSKSDALEAQRQQLSAISDRIQSLMIEYRDKVEKCNKFKEAFSKQNIQDLLDKESKKLNKEISDLESNAADGYFSNPMEVFQNYYDMKKKYHNLEIIKSKMPSINFNSSK